MTRFRAAMSDGGPTVPRRCAHGGDLAGLDPSIEIVVCIPCFRRPQHLRQTCSRLPPAHRPPLRRGDRRERCFEERRAFRWRPNSWRWKVPGLCVVEAAAGQLPCDQRRVRDRAADVSGGDELADDRSMTKSPRADMAGADGRRRRPPAPTSSAGRYRRISTMAEARLRRHPAFAPAYDSSGPVPVIDRLRQLPDPGRLVFARRGTARVRFLAFFNFLGWRRHRFLLPLPEARHAISRAARGRDQRDRAGRNRTSLTWLGDARPADRGDQLSRSSARRRRRPGCGRD